MKSAYPTSGELTTRLTAMGLTLPSDCPALASAISEWESLTGLKPFLASGTATARSFTMTGQDVLPLVAAEVASVVLDGTTLTAGDDYFIQDADQPARFRPITGIEFPRWIKTADVGGLVVTAKWGWAIEIEDDVWEAVLRLAVAHVIDYRVAASVLAGSVTGGIVTKIKQADVSYEFGGALDVGQVSQISNAYRAHASNLAGKYRIAGIY